MTSLTQPLATSMADERQRADDEMHDDGTVTSTMTADAIEYTISGEIHSGVGVLDKTVKILDALESGPATLGQLVSATGLARPTAHRLAIALERHRFVLRDQHGRFVLGSRFAELAAAAGEDRLLTAAGPILQTLLDRTGESAQIYRRQGDQRVCIAAVERASGLRDSIPVGAMLSIGGRVGRADSARLGGFRAAASGAEARQVHRREARCRAQARLVRIGERARRGRLLHLRADPQRLRSGHRRDFHFRPVRPYGQLARAPLRPAGHGRRQIPDRRPAQGQLRSLTAPTTDGRRAQQAVERSGSVKRPRWRGRSLASDNA